MSDQATAKATDQTEPAEVAHIRHLPDCATDGRRYRTRPAAEGRAPDHLPRLRQPGRDCPDCQRDR